jgi:hypothetical protein
MTLPSLVGAVDGWCDNTVPDARWWRTTSGRDRRQPDVARRTVRSRGVRRARPGLDQALAAVRSGDTLVVPKLDRLARSVPDARHLDLKGYGALMINRHPDRLRNRQVTGCLRDGLLAANPDGCRGAPYFFTTDALPAA